MQITGTCLRHAGADLRLALPAAPMNHFADRLQAEGLLLRRGKTQTLQINVGKLCNITCMHCHVNAGPKRTEIMTRDTVDRILKWLGQSEIPVIDITGGSPEMIPDFRYLVDSVRALSPTRKIIDRCNLTILQERGYEWVAEFLASRRVEIIASMPCYSAANVNLQRGEAVFERSIAALRRLNRLGYGVAGGLQLHLVYNPIGPSLPPNQPELEGKFKRELAASFGIVFNSLYTLTNMPVGRFGAFLRFNNKLDDYMDLLIGSFNARTVPGLMCRTTISVGWRGEVYDCDFNQQLGMQWRNGKELFLWDLDTEQVEEREIMTGNHCLACTAGTGSSCGGALV
jgi:radical SAM/Cys-rich protein